MTDPVSTAVGLVRRVGTAALRRYHRHDVTFEQPLPDRPCLIVGSHGFGGIVDLNVLATIAALGGSGDDRPITILTHQLAWTLGVGKLIETVGAVPASREAAHAAFAAGHHVLVFPGGDLEAAKPWSRRNQVEFHGRIGFARLAMDEGVPIVPTVTAGAGESLLVVSDGMDLAAKLGVRDRLRIGALPVSVSIPWGINIGLVGLLPYFPLPTKLSTVIMPAIERRPDQSSADLAARVQAAMQAKLTELTAHRTPIIGP